VVTLFTFVPGCAASGISLVKALESDVGKFVFLKGKVDFFQDAGRLGLDDANVMNASRTDPNDPPVH
jgi:hypothetical protein